MSNPFDPKGFVRESYRIEGITAGECRSIFIDWALSLPLGTDQATAAAGLLTPDRPVDHPMTTLLREAVDASAQKLGRRGGRAGRFSGAGQSGTDA